MSRSSPLDWGITAWTCCTSGGASSVGSAEELLGGGEGKKCRVYHPGVSSTLSPTRIMAASSHT